MFSATTTAASITMPTANARPASEITLRLRPVSCSTMKVASSEIGIARGDQRGRADVAQEPPQAADREQHAGAAGCPTAGSIARLMKSRRVEALLDVEAERLQRPSRAARRRRASLRRACRARSRRSRGRCAGRSPGCRSGRRRTRCSGRFTSTVATSASRTGRPSRHARIRSPSRFGRVAAGETQRVLAAAGVDDAAGHVGRARRRRCATCGIVMPYRRGAFAGRGSIVSSSGARAVDLDAGDAGHRRRCAARCGPRSSGGSRRCRRACPAASARRTT